MFILLFRIYSQGRIVPCTIGAPVYFLAPTNPSEGLPESSQNLPKSTNNKNQRIHVESTPDFLRAHKHHLRITPESHLSYYILLFFSVRHCVLFRSASLRFVCFSCRYSSLVHHLIIYSIFVPFFSSLRILGGSKESGVDSVHSSRLFSSLLFFCLVFSSLLFRPPTPNEPCPSSCKLTPTYEKVYA